MHDRSPLCPKSVDLLTGAFSWKTELQLFAFHIRAWYISIIMLLHSNLIHVVQGRNKTLDVTVIYIYMM